MDSTCRDRRVCCRDDVGCARGGSGCGGACVSVTRVVSQITWRLPQRARDSRFPQSTPIIASRRRRHGRALDGVHEDGASTRAAFECLSERNKHRQQDGDREQRQLESLKASDGLLPALPDAAHGAGGIFDQCVGGSGGKQGSRARNRERHGGSLGCPVLVRLSTRGSALRTCLRTAASASQCQPIAQRLEQVVSGLIDHLMST
jgi:hypothetical protein